LLIDEFVPDYDFRERHQIFVPAPAEAVRGAADAWQTDASFLWRWLMRLRGLGSPHGTLRESAAAYGFLCLADTDEEVVYGQAGRFWSPNERAAMLCPRTGDEFRILSDPRYAIAAMNIKIEPQGSGGTRVYTETRVRCLGASSRRWFRLYWLTIRPFSGLLRHAMLRGIRAEATGKARTARAEAGTS
jgi:Protein of unknown function (DUF2867)